jgi:hypothetical protein
LYAALKNSKTKNKDVKFDPELELVFTEHEGNESVQITETESEQARCSSPRLNTSIKQHRCSHPHLNTNPKRPIRNKADEEVQEFFNTNMSSPEVDRCRDLGAPKPANRDIPPTVRRSLQNCGKGNRYTLTVKACVMALCTTSTFESTHPIIPLTDPSQIVMLPHTIHWLPLQGRHPEPLWIQGSMRKLLPML